MKFKELLEVVDDDTQIKALIILYRTRFSTTHYKNYYITNPPDLLESDVQKIQTKGEELIVYLK